MGHAAESAPRGRDHDGRGSVVRADSPLESQRAIIVQYTSAVPYSIVRVVNVPVSTSRDSPPSRCSRRRRWLARPPLRPASRASSLVHSCAVPFWWAAFPPLLAISFCLTRSMDAKPRSSLATSNPLVLVRQYPSSQRVQPRCHDVTNLKLAKSNGSSCAAELRSELSRRVR